MDRNISLIFLYLIDLFLIFDFRLFFSSGRPSPRSFVRVEWGRYDVL